MNSRANRLLREQEPERASPSSQPVPAPSRRKRLKPVKRPSPAYRQMWRVVDGAVRDALQHHPNYVAGDVRERTVRESINKRVVGAVIGFAQESAKGRSGQAPAAESGLVRVMTGRFFAWCCTALRRLAGLFVGPASPFIRRASL